jgi:Domain of unknown function (DUF4157)
VAPGAGLTRLERRVIPAIVTRALYVQPEGMQPDSNVFQSRPERGRDRRCGCGGVAGPEGECAACRARRLARERASGGPARRQAPPIVHDVVSRSGTPIPGHVRAVAEQRFRHDFSRVRVHADAEAERSADAVDAAAYAVGPHVVFGSGRFAPETRTGRRLLWHELVHVVQQDSAAHAEPGTPIPIAESNTAEDEARSLAADSTARAAPERYRSGRRVTRSLQRQARSAGAGETDVTALSDVPYEKWSPELEAQYRRRMDPRADAIAACRLHGPPACSRLLAIAEVHRLLAVAQEAKGDERKVTDGVLAALPALKLVPRQVPPLRLLPTPTPEPIPPGVPGGAIAGAGAAAIIAIVVECSIQLWQLGQFEEKLRDAGFVILDSPLAVCVGGCHLPANPSAPFPHFGGIDPDLLKSWLPHKPPASAAPTPEHAEPEPRGEPGSVPKASGPKAASPPVAKPGMAPGQKRHPKQKDDCSNELYDQLRAKIENCKGLSFSCSDAAERAALGITTRKGFAKPGAPRWDCVEILRRLGEAEKCAKARDDFQSKCFPISPGDREWEDHQKQLADWKKAAQTCLDKALARNCL